MLRDVFGDHAFSTYLKFSEKLRFLILSYAQEHVAFLTFFEEIKSGVTKIVSKFFLIL